MGKKKINIILIIAVLALWGTVGFRVVNRHFTSNEETIENSLQKNSFTLKLINKDTFILEKIDRDPFLNKQFQAENTVFRKIISNFPSIKKTTVSKSPLNTPTLSWPELIYYGYIGSKEKNEELVLLKIDSKLCKLKLNESYNGLIVKKKYKDSIEVFFNSQKRIIKSK